MKPYQPRRRQFASFLIGVLFCLIGIAMLIYLTKDFIIDIIREPDPTDEPIGQSLPNEMPATLPNQQGNGVQQDGTLLEPNMDTNQTLEYSSGKLGEAHGNGGRSHLRLVSGKYTSKEEYVHRNVHPDLMAMIEAANRDGVSLTLVSAYRSYGHQKGIWERKWGDTANDDRSKASNILRYSSFPGSSRHHWGTDVDFNSVALNYWRSPEGRQTHNWLVNNAPSYGFCEIYAPGRGRGYSDEPWHWSHILTANKYYNQMSQPQVLNIALSQNIRGAKAVKSMSDTMMGYITGVSNCPQGRARNNSRNVIASSNETMPSSQARQAPQSYQNNNAQPYLNPSESSFISSPADTPIYVDDEGMNQDVNNKPPLPRDDGPMFKKVPENNSKASIQKYNAN